MDYKSNSFFGGCLVFITFLLCAAYSNHFTNGFEFDDSHTIANNTFIRDIKNIPLFFTDIKYYGTMPGNQGYNPVLVSLNAIDYWVAGGLNPVYFHCSIFLSYLCLLFLLFFLFKKIFDYSFEVNNKLLALLAVAFYGLHTANAETINYIIMRSDSFSTLCIVASILLYIHPSGKKYLLYLVPIALGIGTKETGVMAGPILFFYILFFEEEVSLYEFLTFRKTKSSLNALKKALPSLIISFGLFFIIRKLFIPAESTLIANSAAPDAWKYFYTQWVVITHYIGNFILPLDLSADPDFELYPSIINRKVLLSLGLLLCLVTLAFFSSKKKETRPIAFGILWFFIALAPTSSFISLGQIANDHRTFFPYIGLVISLGCAVFLLIKKHEQVFNENKMARAGICLLIIFILSLHSYGTYQRNKIWSSSRSLWYDVTVKSPNNGRGQMNYALTLMSEGKYEETLPYFKKALELMPYWAAIHINMGILREAMGHPEEAEQYFLNAIRFQPWYPDGYYYYGRWLYQKGRINEAIAQLQKGNSLSPGYENISELLKYLQAQNGASIEERIQKFEKYSAENPTAKNYIELGMLYYNNKMLKECVAACEKAIALDPASAVAYNNMCSAYNEMEQWEKAASACTKALEIDPKLERAQNNLNWSKKNLAK